MRNKTNTWQSMDWFTVILYLILLGMGVISICGACYDYDHPTLFSLSARPGMQVIWIAVSVCLVFLIMMLDKHFFETFSYIIYGLVMILLIITIFVHAGGKDGINGSFSWLPIAGNIRIQPAEFAKFATALALAKFISSYDINLSKINNLSISFLIILIPVLCIILQAETGSALVFLAFSIALYREGMSGYFLFSSICAIVFFIIVLKFDILIWNFTPKGDFIVTCMIPCIMIVILRYVFKERILSNYVLLATALTGIAIYVVSLFTLFDFTWITKGLIIFLSVFLILYSIRKLVWKYLLLSVFALLSLVFISSVDYVFDEVLKPHQQQRIRVSLGMADDPAGAGYNVNQSMIAIGSGGFSGKGFLNGTQTKLKYVPEQDTDFIFCTVGEEFGFIGSFLVIFIYGLFILRLIFLAERQDSTFGRVYGYSVASIFFFHVLVNIGMVCGITPVVGIPLPFISYGGSSLLGFTILLFIFLRIDAARKEY